MHHLAEDVARQPFQRFLGTGRTAHHVTHRRDDFLHTHFPVIRFELRQFLEAERHAHLVASCRADQAVYLVEVQRRQLVHDNAHGDIFALSRIHTGNEAVQDKGIQRSDNAFHFRIVRYQQVARILRVAHFQVEVITVTVEYPVTLFGRQTRGIDAQCTDHTFQLFHRAIFQSGLERTEQRGNLVVGLQYLEDGLVTLVQERQDMRHIRILA